MVLLTVKTSIIYYFRDSFSPSTIVIQLENQNSQIGYWVSALLHKQQILQLPKLALSCFCRAVGNSITLSSAAALVLGHCTAVWIASLHRCNCTGTNVVAMSNNCIAITPCMVGIIPYAGLDVAGL